MDQVNSKQNGFILIAVVITLKAANPILFKEASLRIEEFSLINILSNYLFIASFILFGLRAITWQSVLRYFPLSFAYPFMSLSYITMMAVGFYVFDEPVTMFNIFGASLIILGNFILAKSK